MEGHLMPTIAEQVQAASGAPASVRIGTVTSVAPTVISAQGVTFSEVGILASYTPVEGDTVALLGQSPTSGSDPTSWLVLGKINPSV
jgi:hypothetical protein